MTKAKQQQQPDTAANHPDHDWRLTEADPPAPRPWALLLSAAGLLAWFAFLVAMAVSRMQS